MIRLEFYVRDSQEIDRRHVPQISEAIRGSGGIEQSYVSTKAKNVSTLREPAQLADQQGTLCVSALYPYIMASSAGQNEKKTSPLIPQQMGLKHNVRRSRI